MGSSKDTSSDAEGTRRFARRFVLLSYVSVLGYLVIVGLVSVVLQVFWPQLDANTQNANAQDCTRAYQDLYEDARHYAAKLIDNEIDITSPRELKSFFEVWDQRFLSTADVCGGPQATKLNRFRHRLELTLNGFLRRDARLGQRFELAQESAPELR